MWGLFGGFTVEGLELYNALRRNGRWPWTSPGTVRQDGKVAEAGPVGYAIAETVRLVIGAGLAWAAAATGQIAGPLGALGVGVAAPTIIGLLAKYVPLNTSPESPGNPALFAMIPPDPPGQDGAQAVRPATAEVTE